VDSTTAGGDLSIAASRDVGTRYSIHVGSARRYINCYTESSWGWVVPPMFEDRWYHVAFVYDSPQVFRCYVDGVPYASQYNTGYTIGAGGHMSLGPMLDQTFQIGSSSASGRERFIGGIDEVAIYEDALTDAQVAAHYRTMSLALSPSRQELVLPAQPGPAVATVARPLGSIASIPVTLAFDSAIISVDAGTGPIASGSIVTIPAGQPGINLTVTALSPGASALVASTPGFASAQALFPVRWQAGQETIIVDDNFDDNPAADTTQYLTAILTNLLGPGEGFYYLTAGKTQQETGTEWQSIDSGANYNRSLITGKEADEVAIMTPQGAAFEWTISNVSVSVDNAVSQPQFVGGELADCYHQLGLVSANRLNNGDNELYAVDSAGGLFIALFYERNTSNTDLIVTGNVRAVNKSKVGNGDLENVVGLETLATFTLPGITSITPQNPLIVNLKANINGWSVGFSPNAAAVFTLLPAVPGVQIGAGGRLTGGWDDSSLKDAAITDEFNNGAFATAQFQNMTDGRGASAIDRIRVCIGCTVVGDCPNPFADADRDGDVDMTDFGLFQACYAAADPQAGNCSCFMHDTQAGIGVGDLFAFVSCFSGSNVPANPGCDDQ
jgi:hypothetical protein